jgi:hypothetical protein
MAAVPGKIFGMNLGGKQFWLALAAMFLFIAVLQDRAQQLPMGHATGFNSNMYFEPPNEEKVKMKLSGDEALPEPGGLLGVKAFKIETLNTNGTLVMTAQAPNCTIDLLENQADSEGHLKVRSGDGRYFLEGDGFLIVWRTNAMSLTLSNHVHTLIATGLLRP